MNTSFRSIRFADTDLSSFLTSKDTRVSKKQLLVMHGHSSFLASLVPIERLHSSGRPRLHMIDWLFGGESVWRGDILGWVVGPLALSKLSGLCPSPLLTSVRRPNELTAFAFSFGRSGGSTSDNIILPHSCWGFEISDHKTN